MAVFFIVAGALVLALFIAPVFYKVFNFGTVAGIAFGLFSLLSGVYWKQISNRMQGISMIVVVFGLIFGLKLMFDIFSAGRTKATSQQVIIILGCQVKGDKPSLSLQKRADAAYRFLLKNPNSVAILSGGQGKGEKISEAKCLQGLLYDRGILNDRLIMEDKSTTTDENIRFSKEIMEKLGLDCENVAIATSEYHQKRASMICKRYGLTAYAQSAHTKLILLPTFLLREVFGIIKEKYNIRLK